MKRNIRFVVGGGGVVLIGAGVVVQVNGVVNPVFIIFPGNRKTYRKIRNYTE